MARVRSSRNRGEHVLGLPTSRTLYNISSGVTANVANVSAAGRTSETGSESFDYSGEPLDSSEIGMMLSGTEQSVQTTAVEETTSGMVIEAQTVQSFPMDIVEAIIVPEPARAEL